MVRLNPREKLDATNHSLRFVLTHEDFDDDCFSRQYYHFYNARSKALRERVEENVKVKLGESVNIRHLEDINIGENVVVIGTIEKRIDARPSVLKEIAEDEHKIVDDENENDTSSCVVITKKDIIEFEDETQIVKLIGNIEMKDVVTGCTVGLYGKQVKDNIFEVEKIIWPKAAIQYELPSELPPYTIAFVSGLNLNGDWEKDDTNDGSVSLLLRWLTGCGMGEYDRIQSNRIVRLIICGCSIASSSLEFEMKSMATCITREEIEPDIDAFNELDSFISLLSTTMDVDVLPGLGDPSPSFLPQQPFPRTSFPLSAISSHIRLQTNPLDITYNGIDFLITSGQNASDISSSPVEALQLILKSQHISPTCPDTVDGFPFMDRDPFVIDRCFPHVIVAGNQSIGESKKVMFDDNKECLLIGVPSFSESHIISLLDLQSMTVSHKYFGVD